MKILTICFSLVCFAFSTNISAIPPIPDIPPFPQIVSGNTTYHLNNVLGSDANDGSVATPWGSLNYAAGFLLPGDTLIVHGTGTPYDSQWINLVRSDTDTQWITIEGRDGANGERATLTGRISFGDTKGGSVSYIYLTNVVFQGPGSSNINIVIYSNSHHLAFENIEIDCQSDVLNERAIWTNNNVQHLWFKDMDVHHCGYKRNVPFTDPVSTFPTDCGGICIKGDNIDEVVFLNVKATQNVGDGLGGGSAIAYGNSYFKQCLSQGNTGDGYDIGGTRVVFIDNIASDNGGHQGAGFKVWSKETWLVNSIAYNNLSLGMSVKPQHSGVNNAYILNSTLAKNNIGIYGGQISTSRVNPPNGNLFLFLHNNIFHSLNTAGVLLNNTTIQFIQEESHNYYFSEYDSSLPLLSWTYKHAIHLRDGTWDDLNNNGVWDAGEPWNIVGWYTFSEVADGGRWSVESGQGVGNIGETDLSSGKSDPGFINLGLADLHLSADSLAIDAGIDVGIPTDADGTPVPIGVLPDIGAYEFGNNDSDSDGITDYNERCFDGDCSTYSPYDALSNPLGGDLDANKPDTDGDGFNDGDELAAGSNPLDIADKPALGDINNDGNINAVDILLIARIVLGNYSPTAGEAIRADTAPLNAGVPVPDGRINTGDLVIIIQLAIGQLSF